MTTARSSEVEIERGAPGGPTALRPGAGHLGPRPGGASPLAVELTFVGRGLRHTVRNVDVLVTSLALPVMIMLLFVYVFGTAIDTGADYVDFVVPGIVLLCAGFGAASTAVGVCQDKVGGVLDRVRTLPVRSSAVLTGHVVASLARNLVSTAVVVVVALLVGFRPSAGPLEWLAALGLIALFILALTWVATAIGLIARSVESANAFAFFVTFLPYLSSAFVPTRDLAPVLRAVAEHQPVTPLVDTLRGLLTGTPIGTAGWWAVAWCLALLVPSVAWASWLFRRTRDA
jgi:ABC-2 type transport system permease protein